MTTGALTAPGSETGERRGARDTRVTKTKPPWRGWRTRSRAARAIRFVESYCRVPSGHGHGRLIKLHPYQRESVEALLAEGAATGGLQIPRGNAKSTLCAAIGVWALCDPPDSPQVPLIAQSGIQAGRTLLEPVRNLITMCDDLASRTVVYSAAADRRVWSAWNRGNLFVLPADVDRVQGLNPTLALIDEAQTVAPEVFRAVSQGAGKRDASLVLAIGTPAAAARDSALFDMRERALAGAAVSWVEYAAREGCDVHDRTEWHRANPALAAGLLRESTLADELGSDTVPGTLDETSFRMYRLGQWVDVAFTNWLPPGAWDAQPFVDVPPDGAPVFLALAGTWTSTVAVVGATVDGAVFLAYLADTATDDVLHTVFADAAVRWDVLGVTFAPRTREALHNRLAVDGFPVDVWPNRTDIDVSSSTEWRRAIVEGRVPHDHHPDLAAHVGALVGAPTPDGSLRLTAPHDGSPVDAARAARMAWWRAMNDADAAMPAIY